ncbi:hypothetical protein GGF31_000492 [Allomyces arbusculus]|nr:hypothetical protein GGF31_000492 [Allomyces arbusculus]
MSNIADEPHAPVKLWDVTKRGHLVALNMDNTETTVSYYNATTQAIEFLSFPTCLVEDHAAATPSFRICTLVEHTTGLHSAFPATNGSYFRIHDTPTTRTWTYLVHAWETAPTSIATFRGPIPRATLQAAGIADVRGYWHLNHKPADLRRIATASAYQLLAIYLARVIHAVDAILAPNPGMPRVRSVVAVISHAYAASGLEAGLKQILHVLPGQVDLFRAVYREFGAVHAHALDQTAECLRAPLTVLFADYTSTCFTANTMVVPVGDFVKEVPGAALGPVCDAGDGRPVFDANGESTADRVARAWVAHLETDPASTLAHVSDIILSGTWPPALVDRITAAALSTNHVSTPHALPRRVHVGGANRAAAAVLLQQHSTCTCGTRHPFRIRCDLVAHDRVAGGPRVVPGTLDPGAPARQPAAGGWAYATARRNEVVLLGRASEVHVHERGYDVEGMCISRVDPRNLGARPVGLPRGRFVKRAVPGGWVVKGCRDPRAVRKLHSGDDVVLDYYVQDKKWF